MSDLTVDDGATLSFAQGEQRNVTVDWDGNLNAGVSIASSEWTITAIKPDGVAVASITRSGATATVTTAEAHELVTGDYATIEGADQADYNVTAAVVVTGTTTFTYAVANTPTTPATGTLTAAYGCGMNSASILSGAPYNSRYTQIRIVAGDRRARGRRFNVENTIVSSESPTQRKPRGFKVEVQP